MPNKMLQNLRNPLPQRYVPIAERILLLFIFVLLVISIAMELVSFKTSAIAFPQTSYVIGCVYCLFHSILMFTAVLYHAYVKGNGIPTSIQQFPTRRFLPLGIFQALSTTITFVAVSRDVSGSLLIILLQLPLPASIVISKCYWRDSGTPLARTHAVAIAIVIVGGLTGCVAAALGELNDDNHQWWYAVIVFVCAIPGGCAVISRETIQATTHIPLEYMQAWASIIQFLTSLIIAPGLFKLENPNLGMSDLWSHTQSGLSCLLTNSETSELCPYGSHSKLRFTFWLFISVCVTFFMQIINQRVTPLLCRLGLLCGVIGAFVCFQTGVPSLLIDTGSDTSDECLLLGILCVSVGTAMLLMDFSPDRSGILLDYEFEELQSVPNDASGRCDNADRAEISTSAHIVEIDDHTTAAFGPPRRDRTIDSRMREHSRNHKKRYSKTPNGETMDRVPTYDDVDSDSEIANIKKNRERIFIDHLLKEREKNVKPYYYRRKRRIHSFHSQFYSSGRHAPDLQRKFSVPFMQRQTRTKMTETNTAVGYTDGLVPSAASAQPQSHSKRYTPSPHDSPQSHSTKRYPTSPHDSPHDSPHGSPYAHTNTNRDPRHAHKVDSGDRFYYSSTDLRSCDIDDAFASGAYAPMMAMPPDYMHHNATYDNMHHSSAKTTQYRRRMSYPSDVFTVEQFVINDPLKEESMMERCHIGPPLMQQFTTPPTHRYSQRWGR